MNTKLSKFKKKLGTNQKSTIAQMRLIGKALEGRVISKTYVNAKTKLTWECKEKHLFEMTSHAVKSGKWCPKCATKKRAAAQSFSIKDCHKFAKSKGGECLSLTYINSKQKLKWKCGDCSGTWLAPFGQVTGSTTKNGTWCPHCNSVPRITLSDLENLANERGGLCLSKSYKSAHFPIRWKCSIGHTWKSSWNSAKNGSWCPECKNGLGERICRAYFEQLLNCKFPKVRPKWLINSDGFQMELDGYCEKLKVAFEHQGSQHKKENGYYSKSSEHFQKRQKDDQRKRDLCKLKGIKLIEVDELFVEIKLEDLNDFLVRKFREESIKIPKGNINKLVDLSKSYSANLLGEVIDIAKSQNGKCISDYYAGTFTKLRFKCSNSRHPEFSLSPTKLKSGQWCKLCGKENWLETVHRNHFDVIKKVALSKKGKIISETYPGRKGKVLAKCMIEAHPTFWTTPAAIDSGKWCRLCAHERIAHSSRNTIESVQKLAALKNGKCLSRIYVNNHTKLTWRCEQGHSWEAAPKEVMRGRWCPTCAKEKRKKRED
jgi:hypothetical protein